MSGRSAFLAASAFSLLVGLPLAAGAQDWHFFDDEGRPLPRFEPIHAELARRFGDRVPGRIAVSFYDGNRSRFDVRRSRVLIGERAVAGDLEGTVAHESAHLCMAALTGGASVREEFRFLDEGYADIFRYRFLGSIDEYKTEAVTIGAVQSARGKVSFAQVRKWSAYYGDPAGRTNENAYPVGSSFEFFAMDRYGEPRLFDFFRDLGTTKDLGQSLERVFGESEEAVERGWLAYLAAVDLPSRQPRVVAMFPESGAVGVDPGIREIWVEFDSPMRRSVYFVTSSAVRDQISYRNAAWKTDRILAVRVELKPNRSYAISLGDERRGRFSNRLGLEMPPTPWTFSTGPGQ